MSVTCGLTRVNVLGVGACVGVWAVRCDSRRGRTVLRARQHSTPNHLAHGLLDHARYLALHDPEAAEEALGEARDIAARMSCQPLLDRAADLARATPPVQA